MEISSTQLGHAQLVALRGVLHMDDTEELQPALRALVRPDTPHLIVDLSELQFIGSAGLAALIAAHNTAREHDGSVRLVNPQPRIAELLRITHIDQFIPVHPSVEDAQAAAAGD